MRTGRAPGPALPLPTPSPANRQQQDRLRAKQPELKPTREAQLVALWQAGNHTTLDLAEMFDVAHSTVYRAIQRTGPAPSGTRQDAAQPRTAPATQRCENRATYRCTSPAGLREP